MTPHNGGPAFPQSATFGMQTLPDGGKIEIETAGQLPGMSLRDYFAGQALSSRGLYGANIRAKEVAQECYEIADAMLAARETTNTIKSNP